MEYFPKVDSHDPSLLSLDPDRYERTNIPAGPPPEQPPAVRLQNFDMVLDEGAEKFDVALDNLLRSIEVKRAAR